MEKLVPLAREFYEPTADLVAPKLLGHWLVRRTAQGVCAGAIVETEAYVTGDPAAHSFVGQTARNRVMWGAAGHAYVYFIYGNHYCFNTVCRPPGIGEAVLVRAVEPVMGVELMRARRVVATEVLLTNGPGKLCEAMEIDRSLDGADLCDPDSMLFIARNPKLKSFIKERAPMVTTTRIGITKAATMPLRFYLDGSAFVSKW